jgi:hypothetical protein
LKVKFKYLNEQRTKALVGFISLCFLVLVSSSFHASWTLLSRVLVQAKYFQTDRMGNFYVLSQTNQLTKYDNQGKLVSTLNYSYLGNISFLDAGNPLEIYLFYKEMNALVFLDNNLAYRGRINLSDVGILQASAAARSYANGIWVFDQGDFQLKKLNKDGSLSQASGNILQFAQSKNLNPNLIIDNGNRVILCDSSEGIMVFDVFANYLKTISIKGKLNIKMLNDALYFTDAGNLISYRFSTLKRDTLALPENTFNDFSLEKDRLYLQNDTSLSIYSFQEY